MPAVADPLPAFADYRASGDPRRLAELVERHRGLAVHLARRFSGSAEEEEDLRQVALLGLVAAIRRFDPTLGTSFSSFAVPTIVGELKRHLRDTTWALKVPRRAKEASLRVARSTEELTIALGRPPTPEEIAAETQLTRAEVDEAAHARHAYRTRSLDAPARAMVEDPALIEDPALGGEEPAYDVVIDLTTSRPVLRGLPPQQRLVLQLRYYDDLTQAEIADRLGVSQAHVSRLLRRALTTVRHGVG